jgi:hypothetical protein
MLTATLFPKRTPPSPGRRHVYRYNVEFNGELVVQDARDPECDLARVLLAKGITGWVTIVDGSTGKPRTVVDIEKAAKVYASDPDRGGLCFHRHDSNPWAESNLLAAVSPRTGETDFPVVQEAA